MAQSSSSHPSILVKQVARLIQSFNQEQLAQLIELVPQLRDRYLQPVGISAEQAELSAYFDRQLARLADYPPLQDDDPFIGGLSVAEFFSLPETEQARLWDEAHAEAERNLEQPEQPVQPDALPAR